MTKIKRPIGIVIGIGIVLMIPLVAMQFTDEFNWSGFDFLVMGILLLCAGLITELILRKVKNGRSKILLIVFFIILFLLIWAELAVGIFGTPWAGD